MAQKLKVPSTSRLVLEAAMSLYTSPLQQRYIAAIDFSETSGLFYDLKRQYSSIVDIICLRKESIRQMLQEKFSQSPQQQVVILGAGLDPLSLYLLENYANDISHIIEIDNGYIEEKQKIYTDILPETVPIHFSRCDITDTDLLWHKLRENGYKEALPTTIIFEGVFHYIRNEAFIQLMKLFRTTNHRNTVMMDYFLSDQEVPDGYLPAQQRVLELIETALGLSLNIHSRAVISSLLEYLDADQVKTVALHEVEKKLTGSNQLLHAPGEGLLEMVHFNI
ncbi:class I SAM-dependent methyltransferase [Chitinophaga sp. 30R24]|uniref:class I SAM-dependent methyltransferase n=1 Tax=Chitinophaga sp. 30R24 TaxID=3248838 RepID=UPI003B8F4BEF